MRRTVSILLLMITCAVRAQDTHWEFAIGGEYMVTGYSLASPHNASGTGLEVTWLRRMEGDACWVRMRHHPSVGLRLGLGITPQGISGNRIGVTPVLRTPLSAWLDLDLGLGVSVYSRPSFVSHDTANVYISTPATWLIDVGLVAHLDERSHVALKLLHSSNGNMRRPNRGLNYLNLEVGMALGKDFYEYKKEPGCAFNPWHEVGVMVAPSLAFSRHATQQGLFFCYDVSLNYEYRRTPLWGVGASVDLWYNFSYAWQVSVYHDRYTFPMYMGAMPFVEFYWGALSVKGGVGVTLLASNRVSGPVYERLGVYYNFGDCYAGIGINAHYGQAEFVEWSFGYRLKPRAFEF